MVSAGRFRTLLLLASTSLAVGACQPAAKSIATTTHSSGLNSFADEAELDVFAKKMAEMGERQRREYMTLDIAESAAPAEAEAGNAASDDSITNTQEAGVDEGGIVKRSGDYLVVLRRGRLFTIRVGESDLTPADAVDAYAPEKQNPGSTWYDEMLVRGDQVIVIGYSYGDYGTEVNRFTISGNGQLTFRDTHYLRSGDYYSSSNYASRLIGDELIFYAPVFMDWGNWRERLPSMRDGAADSEPEPLVAPEDLHIAQPYRDGRYFLNVAHTVTRCDVSTDDLECTAQSVVGTWSRAFYVSRDAVYVWTGLAHEGFYDSRSPSTPGQLIRMPLDGATPGSVQSQGSPVDQFSFAEDADDGVLRVVLREQGAGEGMWAGEFSRGDAALLTIPFEEFGDGSEGMERSAYRKLPRVDGWRFHNRFVGDWLLYAGGNYGREGDDPHLYAVPLAGGDTVKMDLPHGVTRFDRMGSDGIAVGPGERNTLGFSAISLGNTAKLEDTYLLASAGEGETRSQAFFYRPDRGSAAGASGTLGLPVTRSLERNGSEFLGSGSSIFFMRRDNREFSPAGELVAASETAVDDNCKASCVDWYGNARPIFIGDRIFALMGYELVEGRLNRGSIKEVRRTNFAPRTELGG